jgi:hypothetical protein
MRTLRTRELTEGHRHRQQFRQMLRRSWALPAASGNSLIAVAKSRAEGGGSEPWSVRVENLTSVGARCEGVCGMARSIREQGRTLPREVHSWL